MRLMRAAEKNRRFVMAGILHESAAGAVQASTCLLAITLRFPRPPSTTKPHVLCKTTNFTKKGHRYRGTLG